MMVDQEEFIKNTKILKSISETIMEQGKKSKTKLYIIIALLVLVFLGFKLYKMNEVDHYKNLLQKEFNRQYQSWGHGSFCYNVGNVQLPYIDKGYPAELISQVKQLNDRSAEVYQFPDYNRDKNRYQLNFLLPIYYEMGLLSRQLVEGAEYYQYDLTEEGKKYQSEYDDNLVFCYGYQKVLEVTDILKKDSLTYKGKTEVTVTYNYELDDVPSWLANEHFIKIYQSEQDKYRKGQEIFIEGNGKVFVDGLFNRYIYNPKLPTLN